MGGGSWTASAWDSYKRTSIGRKTTAKEIFDKESLSDDLNIYGKCREARDSEDHPKSTPIIVALDVTGSMGEIAALIAREGLKTLAEELYSRKPVDDPQIMFMGIGDMNFDKAPVQATQFESDIRIAEELRELYVEGGGGGNSSESYTAAWYMGANKVKSDAWEKRRHKGYIFTIGDELCPPKLNAEHLNKFFGDDLKEDVSAEELYDKASEKFNIFHIIIKEGWFCQHHPEEVKKDWQKMIGQHAMELSDHKALAELIVSTVQVNEGANAEEVADSWDSSTAIVIRKALPNLAAAKSLPASVKVV